MCGHLEVCRFLLQCGADIEAKGNGGGGYYPPLLLLLFFWRTSVLLASSFFRFPSFTAPHCNGLLTTAALKLSVFWLSRKLTSLRGAGASALPPLTTFHSLSALQLGHCTQICHRREQSRRGCIPAQYRRAAMTRSPGPPAAPLPLQ